MIVDYKEFSVAVERLKALIGDAKKEQVGTLFDIDGTNKLIKLAFSDGRRAVVSKVSADIADGEPLGQIIVPYKSLMEFMNIAKPVGTLAVENVIISVDSEKKNINFSVEKVLYLEPDGSADATDEDGEGIDVSEEAERKVIATIKQGFKYNTSDESRKFGALFAADYDKMLGVHTASDENDDNKIEIWDTADFISTIGRLSTEDGSQLILSGKNHSISVKNTNYTVDLNKDEVILPLCFNAKAAKTVVEIFKKAVGGNVGIVIESPFCTVCTEDGNVAYWFETEMPLKRVLGIIDGFKSIQYDKYSLIVYREALLNVVSCVDIPDIVLKFTGDAVNGVNIKVSGTDTTIKSNDYTVEAAAADGDIAELVECGMKVNTETLKAMLSLCNSSYVAIEFGSMDGAAMSVRVSEAFKEGGVITRELKCFTPVTVVK